MVSAAAGGREYRGVQALRAVAALTVVAGHSTDYLAVQNGSLPPVFHYLHGPAGVDIFFVISGFVMAVSAERLRSRQHPARLFLWRRMIRIVPLYWLLTVVRYVAAWVRPTLSVHGRPALRELVGSLAFVPYRGLDGQVHPLLPVGWTLSFEMMFYLLFAAALAVRGGYATVLAPTIFLLAAANVLREPSWPVWTALVNPIVLEFLAGVGVGVLVLRERLPRRWTGVAMAVAGLVVLGFMIPSPPAISRPLVWGTGATALVLGMVVLEPVVGPRLPGWLLALGDASYSIYLMQSFVFPPLDGLLARVAPKMVHQRPEMAGLLVIVSGVACSAGAGWLVYRSVEQPLGRLLRGRAGVERPEPVVSR